MWHLSNIAWNYFLTPWESGWETWQYYWQWIKHICKLCIKKAIDYRTVWERRRKGIKGERGRKEIKEERRIGRFVSLFMCLQPHSIGIHAKSPTEDLLQPLLKMRILSSRDSTWGTVSTWKRILIYMKYIYTTWHEICIYISYCPYLIFTWTTD